MMRLPKFRWFAPRTVAEAAKLIAELGPEAAVVAGGTDLYPNMKRRHQTPKALVALRRVDGLARVTGSPRDGLEIGPCVTLSALARDSRVRETHPALAYAAGTVSTPLLRNMGTLGGNICLDTRCNYYDQSYEWRKSIDFCMKKDGEICWVAPGSSRCLAITSSDTAPVLCALGARLTLTASSGEREIEAMELFNDDGIRYLTKKQDEILTRISLPPPNGTRCAYWKLRRRGSFDFPILGVAARLDLAGGAEIERARIFFTGVHSKPTEAVEAGRLLEGKRATHELLAAAAERAGAIARPFDNTDLAAGWRKQMATVFAQKALLEAAGLGPPQGRA
jgi:4-hydroxybenzoyl-CoA reductase subunit beta